MLTQKRLKVKHYFRRSGLCRLQADGSLIKTAAKRAASLFPEAFLQYC
jgi:hypothetical protein